MKKLILYSALSLLAFASSSLVADTAYVKGNTICIKTDTYTKDEIKGDRYKKLVYYVNVPPSVVSPPNNNAYSSAAISEDYIDFSGVTGQDLQGNPVPLGPNGITQITQAYSNMQAILNYFKIPVTNVTKLDVAVQAEVQNDFLTYRSTCNQVQATIWPTLQPPRTIMAVNWLNLGVVEVTFRARNPYKLKVSSTLD